jgi:F0F1-type ATP synthase assembly protein I
MAESDRPPDEDPSSSSPLEKRVNAEPENFSSWHAMAGIGIEFVVAVGLLTAIGWWLDSKWQTAPWLLITGCALGFAVGLFQMVRTANKMMKK